MTILSHHIPKTNINSQYDEWLDQVHSASALNIKFNFPAYTLFHECRSYSVNNVCTYILKCYDERK